MGNNLPKRKPTRLKCYDYSQNGYYFITICTHNKEGFLSRINVGQGLAPAENTLSTFGLIAEQQLLALEQRYPNVTIDKYVIMPNHIHAIIVLDTFTAGASPCPTLSDVVCTFKSMTARMCRQNDTNRKIFQSSFHDHVIRNEHDYQMIWQYIDNNPTKWAEDCFFCQ